MLLFPKKSVKLKENGENCHFPFLSQENFTSFLTVYQNIGQTDFFFLRIVFDIKSKVLQY